jgi:hypothetical protein
MPQVSLAAWTGIAAFAGQQESDWSLNGQAINADSRLYGLQAEERSRVGLHVGARVSQNSLRLESPLNTPTLEKYEVQQLAFYLRWPIPLNDTLTLHTRVDYQYNTGNRSKIDNDNDIDIDWIETTLETGLSLRMGLFSIRPFVNFSWINGEITTPASITKIELDDGHSAGVLVDIYVERTAFVRLKATASGSDSLFISFVREY